MLKCDLLIKFIFTHDQLADLFTKGLPSPRFHRLTSKLMWKFPFRLRGDESSGSKSSNFEHSNEEDGSTVPMVTSKTVSSVRVVKHKTRLKPNAVVSH